MLEKVYIIFTRHQLSQSQINEINTDAEQFGGIQTCEIVDLSHLAAKNIQSIEDAEEIYSKIVDTIKTLESKTNHIEIYGVIPVPIRYLMFDRQYGGYDKSVTVNESFNINRSNGEKLSHEHYCWLPTGKLFY